MNTVSKGSVLCVDDDLDICEWIRAILTDAGYEVWSAPGALEAIDHAALHAPDVVLMDIMLGCPVDGISLARKLQACFDVPVIYLTASSDDATLQRAKVTEPLAYLVKPLQAEDVKSALEMALYKRRIDQRFQKLERWMSTMLSSIGEGVIATDLQGEVTYMNPVAECLTGRSRSEAVGLRLANVFRLVNGSTGEPTPYPLGRCQEEGPASGLAAGSLLQGPAGICRPIDDTLAPIRDERGRPTGFILAFRDVTQRKTAEEALVRMATTDSLTGLCNRRAVMEHLEREIARSRRHGGPLSAALVDVDHFKRVNDTYGHDAGDAALIHIVRIMTQTLRQSDIVGRLGGDEFIILFPETDLDSAIQVLERLRTRVSEEGFAAGDGPSVMLSLSIGVAQSSPLECGADDLIKWADRAAYLAKARGRNQVASAEERADCARSVDVATIP